MSAVHDTTPNPKRNSVYDVATRVDVNETSLTAKEPRAHKPSYWQTGRDPYANGGAVGQTFLNNPSPAPSNA
jgi:hypothetical protein